LVRENEVRRRLTRGNHEGSQGDLTGVVAEYFKGFQLGQLGGPARSECAGEKKRGDENDEPPFFLMSVHGFPPFFL